MDSPWGTVLAGTSFGLALIVAIGAQNAHVLRSGIRGEHVGLVVAVCAGSDVVLIAVGAAGTGGAVAASPTVLTVVTLLGAVVLLVYGAQAARRVAGSGSLQPDAGGTRVGPLAAVATTLALTWLNPHVYLDTVVLLGSVSATYGDLRWWFALGAALGSVLWFCTLGLGARAMRRTFARPRAWKVLDAVVALMMVGLAAHLVLSLG